jgi:hypothetical protein
MTMMKKRLYVGEASPVVISQVVGQHREHGDEADPDQDPLEASATPVVIGRRPQRRPISIIRSEDCS